MCHTLGNKNYTYLLNLQTIVMLLKHRICNGNCEEYVTFPDGPRNETHQEGRTKAVVFIVHTDNTSSESFLIINPS